MYYTTIYKYIYLCIAFFLFTQYKDHTVFVYTSFFHWVVFLRHMQAPTIPPWRLVSLEAAAPIALVVGEVLAKQCPFKVGPVAPVILVVVSNIYFCSPLFGGKISNSTHIFQVG